MVILKLEQACYRLRLLRLWTLTRLIVVFSASGVGWFNAQAPSARRRFTPQNAAPTLLVWWGSKAVHGGLCPAVA
jgi:hypothetical protein